MNFSYHLRKIKSTHKNLGDYIILHMAVRGLHLGKMKIAGLFNKYVPKKDYTPDERDDLIDDLTAVTKQL